MRLSLYPNYENHSLTGQVPYLYGNLENLEEFFIGGNDLTGIMPGEVCELNSEGDTFIETDCTVTCDCCAPCLAETTDF